MYVVHKYNVMICACVCLAIYQVLKTHFPGILARLRLVFYTQCSGRCCSMLYWLRAGMACENLEKVRQVKTKYKARFEPATFCSTHKSPNHYTTAVVAAANHYFPPIIDKP